MIWSQIAQRYMESFERARRGSGRRRARAALAARPFQRNQPFELPPIKLDHLRRMTDDTGMLQHALFTIPNYDEGYSIDDNARALIVAVNLEAEGWGKIVV